MISGPGLKGEAVINLRYNVARGHGTTFNDLVKGWADVVRFGHDKPNSQHEYSLHSEQVQKHQNTHTTQNTGHDRRSQLFHRI